MIVECPNCKQRFNVMNSSRGEIVNCQSCGHTITLPEIKNGKEVLLKAIPIPVTNEDTKKVENFHVVRNDNLLDKSKLEDCPMCGKHVSPEAKSCPNCGHPIQEPEGFLLGFVFGFFGMIVAAICWGAEGQRRAAAGTFVQWIIAVLIFLAFRK